MAKCEICGKTTTFGHNRSFSMRATNRKFKPNLQTTTIFVDGKPVRKTVCTRCLKTLVKEK
ncbi:MAG: 50S ribosomal protein L28 [Chloroflexi bacterium]|nr:50S ribosomal protein L28 [Chloroflexota bacterium]